MRDDKDMMWKTLSSKYIFQKPWLTAREDTCELPDGRIATPYYVLEFSDWVNAFAITEEGKIILVKQYRHAMNVVSIETPGGCVDKEDNSNEDAMRRELLEETGYAFESVHYLGRLSPNPSTQSNLFHMFIATGGKKIQGQELDPNEDIEILEVSLEEVIKMVQERRIVQAMHVSCIMYALMYLGKLQITI